MDKIEMRWSKWKTNCLIKREGAERRNVGRTSFGSDLSWLAHDEFFFFFPLEEIPFLYRMVFFFFFFVSYNKSEPPSPPKIKQFSSGGLFLVVVCTEYSEKSRML